MSIWSLLIVLCVGCVFHYKFNRLWVVEMEFDFPDLSRMQLNATTIHEKWKHACGHRPEFARWRNMRSTHKHDLLHSVASAADNDRTEDGNYVTAYNEMHIVDLIATRQWSVEHVVPRSHVRSGLASSDPIGWIEATRSANSRRSNLPLYLWQENAVVVENEVVDVDGVSHFVPPMAQRARLARKWLFIRATYVGGQLSPPSVAQTKHAAAIIAHAKDTPIQEAESRMNRMYREMLGWANPLLEDGASVWFDDPSWQKLIFQQPKTLSLRELK